MCLWYAYWLLWHNTVCIASIHILESITLVVCSLSSMCAYTMHKFDIYQFAIRDLRKVNFSSRYSSII